MEISRVSLRVWLAGRRTRRDGERALAFSTDPARVNDRQTAPSAMLTRAHRSVDNREFAGLAEVAESGFQARRGTPLTAFDAGAAFLDVWAAGFGNGGSFRQPGLARLREFGEMFLHARRNAAVARFNSGTLRLDVGRANAQRRAILCHCA
jgi:hypothetical protein